MNGIPCFTDSDDNRFPAEDEMEESQLTPMEQRIEWIFSEWETAINDDTYDEWYSVRMVLYGATQAINQCGIRYTEDRDAIKFLSDIAFVNSSRCIIEGRFK